MNIHAYKNLVLKIVSKNILNIRKQKECVDINFFSSLVTNLEEELNLTLHEIV